MEGGADRGERSLTRRSAARWPPAVRPLPIAIAAALVAAIASPVGGQARDRAFEGRARVVEVQVPVHVSDRDGRPIRGLTAADFEIRDGRKRREISRFEVIDLEVLKPGPSRTEVERAVPAAGRRHFLLLFDLSFSQPASLLRARRAARDFVVDDLHPTDLVAVATHAAERGARILVTFTTDRAQVARAIDTLGAPELLSLTRRDPLSFLIDDPGSASSGLAAAAAAPPVASGSELLETETSLTFWVLGQEMERAQREQSISQIGAWARSLADLARMLDSARGRKQVLYFSEGWDGGLLFGREAGFSAGEQRDEQRRNLLNRHWTVHGEDRFVSTGLQTQVSRMLDVFRRADCVIQSVDIGDLDAAAGDGGRRSRHHALFYVAHESGGELLEGTRPLGERLADVLESTSVTYLLTFRADDVPADGSYRRLEVRAKLPPRASLTARSGYFAPRPFAELHPFEKALLASEAIVAGAPVPEIPIQLLAAPFKSGAPPAYVPVIVEVPGAPLAAGHGSPRLDAEIFAYVTDAQGQMLDFFTKRVSVDLDGGRRRRFEDGGLKYYGQMSLLPGDYLLRVLVRNAANGRFGVATHPLAVPDFDRAHPVLLPPFFIEGDSDWVLLRGSPEADASGSVVYPFTVRGEPFVPAARIELRRRDRTSICLVAYNLGRGDLRVEGTVLDAEGRPVAGGSLGGVERTLTGSAGFDKLLTSFAPRGLEPGIYDLRVAVTDPATGASAQGSVPFRVRD